MIRAHFIYERLKYNAKIVLLSKQTATNIMYITILSLVAALSLCYSIDNKKNMYTRFVIFNISVYVRPPLPSQIITQRKFSSVRETSSNCLRSY